MRKASDNTGRVQARDIASPTSDWVRNRPHWESSLTVAARTRSGCPAGRPAGERKASARSGWAECPAVCARRATDAGPRHMDGTWPHLRWPRSALSAWESDVGTGKRPGTSPSKNRALSGAWVEAPGIEPLSKVAGNMLRNAVLARQVPGTLGDRCPGEFPHVPSSSAS